jgi:hypothetical protein
LTGDATFLQRLFVGWNRLSIVKEKRPILKEEPLVIIGAGGLGLMWADAAQSSLKRILPNETPPFGRGLSP